MIPVFGKISTPSVQQPERPPVEEAQPRLNIFVVFTSVQPTLAALKQAGHLAAELGGRIILVALQVVPYPLPLTRPRVGRDWNERRLRLIAGESRIETIVHLYLCRDRRQTLEDLLSPHSLVVLGGPKHWWRTTESTMARRLRRAGHEVILIQTE